MESAEGEASADSVVGVKRSTTLSSSELLLLQQLANIAKKTFVVFTLSTSIKSALNLLGFLIGLLRRRRGGSTQSKESILKGVLECVEPGFGLFLATFSAGIKLHLLAAGRLLGEQKASSN